MANKVTPVPNLPLPTNLVTAQATQLFLTQLIKSLTTLLQADNTSLNQLVDEVTANTAADTALTGRVVVLETFKTNSEAAWTAYTPTGSSDGGAPASFSVQGRYKKIGRTVHLAIQYTVTTVGGASGNFFVSLPFQAINFNYVGKALSLSSGASGYAWIPAGAAIVQGLSSGVSTFFTGPTTIVISITYEATT